MNDSKKWTRAYPSTGPDKVAPNIFAILGGQNGNRSNDPNKDPGEENGRVENSMWRLVIPDDGHVCMNRNESNETTRCQITVGEEQGLNKAGR